MSQTKVTAILVVGAICAIVALREAMRGRRREVDIGFAVVVLAGVLFTIGSVATTLQGTAALTQDVYGDQLLVTPPSQDVISRYGYYAAAIVFGVLTIHRLCQPAVKVNAAGWLVALWIWVTLSGITAGSWHITTSGLALLLMLTATALLPRSRGALIGGAIFGLSYSALGSLLLLPHYETVEQPCTYKCGVFGGLFTGVLQNGNAMGLLAAVSIPFVYLAFSRGRLVMIAYLMLVVAASGSRTALAGALLGLLALWVIRPNGEDARRRAGVAWLAVAAISIAGFVLPFMNLPVDTFTGRANLWDVARAYLGKSPIVGWGPGLWADLGRQGLIAQAGTYSVHNQWLEMLLSGGIVGGLLFLGFVIAVAGGRSARQASTLALLGFVLALGVLEAPWSLTAGDWLTFTIPALVLLDRTRPPAACAVIDRDPDTGHGLHQVRQYSY